MNTGLKKDQEHGAALVEAALIMLTFLIIIFSIFEAGRLLSIQQTLNNASREGAKLAVLPQAGTMPGNLPTRLEIGNEVNRYLQAAGITGATVRINASNGTNGSDVVGSPDLPPVDNNGTPCTLSGTQFVCNGSATNPQFTRVEVTVRYQLVSISMFSMLQVNLRGEASMRNETSP